MMALVLEDFSTGRWDEAQDLAVEGLRLCESHGYGLQGWFLRAGQALIAAGRGEEALVQSITEQMMRWARPRGVGAVQIFARHARGLSALGRGDFEDAYQQFVTISPPGQFPSYVAYAVKIPLDFIEAAVRSGRQDEAVAHLQAMRDAGLPAKSGRLALMTAAAAALCASDDDAGDLYEAALAVPGAARWPFDLARVHLAYGAHLRRHHAPAAARPHLDTAVSSFEGLRAQPWTTRAGNELRATGQSRQRLRSLIRRSHAAGARDCTASRCRHVEQADRRPPLPVPPHRRHAPSPLLPQARHHHKSGTPGRSHGSSIGRQVARRMRLSPKARIQSRPR